MPAKTQPDHYEGILTAESSQWREKLENDLSALYASLDELKGIDRLRAKKKIERLEQTLSWQGANPKVLPFAELKEHIQTSPQEDAIDAKYQARIKNRATAIRAYCVQCQGGYPAGVRDCVSMTCPFHPFRMGTDPLRGFELPKAAIIVIEDEDDTDALFEEGEEDEADATE